MKKIFVTASIITTIFSANISFAVDYYAKGVTQYKCGNYEAAAKNFEYAVKLNPKDVNSRYYLALAYIKQNYVYGAQKQYNRIILLAPESEAAKLSQQGLSLIRQAELGKNIKKADTNSATIENNYIQYVLTNGNIAKWMKMPITVYIEPKKQKGVVQKSFEKWQAATDGLIKFAFSQNPNSQITVKFKDTLENKTEQSSFVAGYSKPYYKNGNLSKSEITILAIDPDTGETIDDDIIAFTALHEIGHSLGLNGHSTDENDVMFESSEEPKENLSLRDINTIKLLYTVDAQRLEQILKGGQGKKLEQLLAYVKKFPNKAVGYGNLGDYYKSKNEFAKAIQAYQKAIAIEPASAEYYNLLGTTYEKAGDATKAFSNLKRACDLEPSNDFYLNQFVKACKTPEQKQVAKIYLQKFKKAYPSNKNNENIRNLNLT